MLSQVFEHQDVIVQGEDHTKAYAERLVASLGYNDAICTAIEFQLFNVAEELRFMQDEYRGDI